MNIFKRRHSSFFLSETYYIIVSNLSLLLKGPSDFQNQQETRPAPYKGFCAVEVHWSPMIKNNLKLMTFSLSKITPRYLDWRDALWKYTLIADMQWILCISQWSALYSLWSEVCRRKDKCFLGTSADNFAHKNEIYLLRLEVAVGFQMSSLPCIWC